MDEKKLERCPHKETAHLVPLRGGKYCVAKCDRCISFIDGVVECKSDNKPKCVCKHCGREKGFELKFWFIDCCSECFHAGKDEG